MKNEHKSKISEEKEKKLPVLRPKKKNQIIN